MENVKKYAPFIGAFLMFIAVFFLVRKKSGANEQKAQILERAREAKLAKSILKKEEDDAESIPL